MYKRSLATQHATCRTLPGNAPPTCTTPPTATHSRASVSRSALMPSHVPVGLGLYRTFDFGQVHLDPLHHKGAAVARASGEAGPGPGTAAAAGPGPSSTGNLPGSGAGGTSAVRTLGKVNSKQTKDMLASVMAASGALRVESSKGPGRATPAIPEGPET